MKSVLLVDDDKQLATVFQTALTAVGYQVRIATDGNSGLQAAREQKFDMILLDEMMPDMSGNDVLRTLKSDDNLKTIPVAMLTNFGSNDLIKDALDSGAADYILKYQVSPTDLPEKIKGIIGE
ncbi:MAG TPA: response regulator [Patescibacteria group bacterium]|nr:response regulator [Patescibacteria group bacterium]